MTCSQQDVGIMKRGLVIRFAILLSHGPIDRAAFVERPFGSSLHEGIGAQWVGGAVSNLAENA